VGFNATQEASQKTRNIVQFIEFAILSHYAAKSAIEQGENDGDVKAARALFPEIERRAPLPVHYLLLIQK
jgi:hypothetical protein